MTRGRYPGGAYWTPVDWRINERIAHKRFEQLAARGIMHPFVWVSVPFFFDEDFFWVRQVPPPNGAGGLLDHLSGGACCSLQSRRVVLA